MELRKKSSGTAGTQGGELSNLHMNVDTTKNITYTNPNNVVPSALIYQNISPVNNNNISTAIQITTP